MAFGIYARKLALGFLVILAAPWSKCAGFWTWGYGKTEKRNPFAQVRKTDFYPSLQSTRVQLVFCMGCFEVIFGVPRRISGKDTALVTMRRPPEDRSLIQRATAFQKATGRDRV
jgi:hypothetical protein